MDNIKNKDALLKARQYCAIKETCAYDIKNKLDKWNVSESDQENIIRDLYKNKYLDDLRYAKAFSNDKLNFNKWGKHKIRVHLRQKRIKEELIEQALAELDHDIYYTILNQEIQKKLPKIKAKSDYEKKAKLLSFIAGRGFETDLAMDILNDLL